MEISFAIAFVSQRIKNVLNSFLRSQVKSMTVLHAQSSTPCCKIRLVDTLIFELAIKPCFIIDVKFKSFNNVNHVIVLLFG